MNDSTRRAIRTGIDATLAVLASLAAVVIFPGLADALGVDAGILVRVGVIVGALTLFLTKLRNALEDANRIPAVFKAPASDGANPVPDPAEGGYVRVGHLAGIVLIVLVVILIISIV